MTRFDAADPAERRKLVADAISAHRERASPFLTMEADPEAVADEDGGDGADESAASPWIQFTDEERVLNLDVTDAELDRLEALLNEFPAFKIRELTRPEEAEGTNVRVGALADPNRVAQFVDRAFREVYGLDEEFRLWVVEL